MPRLNCTFEGFREIIESEGFVLLRHEGGNHRRYRGEVGGQVRFVDIDPHPSWRANIGYDLLCNMIRQSGLPKKLFRK